MKLLRNRWFIALVAVVVGGALLAWYVVPAAARSDDALVARVKKGDFVVTVTTAGELRARKFVQIQGPPNAQQAETYQMKISSLVPEGTVVKEGDMVAELDRSTIAAKLAEVSLALQKAEAQLQQAMLDSTLNLSQAREDMRTMELTLEEKRIAKEQAQYEAPSIRRQSDIDHEKAQRALAQAKVNYVTKTSQAKAKMAEVGADVERQRNRLNMVQTVMQGFTIKAPSAGMVIYVKEWNGKKKGVGSQINPWDPTVATLPDLTQMESMTYVNEIDVRKLAVGQKVAIGLDSDPTKKLQGTVSSVANVGEQRPNQDSKVFEVKIGIEGADTTLRPGMTTSNAIETQKIKNVLYIPIEAVMSEGAIPFVYKRTGGGLVKQEIETGVMNENEIVVLHGVEEGDAVLMGAPTGEQPTFEFVKLDPKVKTTGAVPADTPAKREIQTTPPPTPAPTPTPNGAAAPTKAIVPPAKP
jgi:multidrug efflux pump subunit AcrA (membrane-fusion protein)